MEIELGLGIELEIIFEMKWKFEFLDNGCC
jgi:hypothetical protein